MKNLHARKGYQITALCELVNKSKQAYYQYDEERLIVRVSMETFALEFARGVREDAPGMGCAKIWAMYIKEFGNVQDVLGRDRFTNLLIEAGMKVRQKVRHAQTTDSSHGLPLCPNLTKTLIPLRINQLWVSDITYIEIWSTPTEYTFCYLSLILDAYSKEVIGWSVGENLTTAYPLEALEKALTRLKDDGPRPIHHSDRGVQYASSEYVKRLEANGIRRSMTESGDPKENAQAERINNTIKNELLKLDKDNKRFHSIDEVRKAVVRAVDFYNNKRPHMSINNMTPSEAAKCTGELKKLWHSGREEAIKALGIETGS